jgi:hypothetical protein
LETLKTAVLKLLKYCQENDWSGYDPYDALNSEIFRALPFLDFRLFRLGFTQVMKRVPFNFRSLLLVPRTSNPKGLALFLAALLKLSKSGLLDQGDLVKVIAEKLISLRSPNTDYWCWGYNFPWQTRTIIVPQSAPNLVCTTFAGNALLDAFDRDRESLYLEIAVSAAEYIMNELLWTEGDVTACFRYPLPTSLTRVHNANFLGAAFLCRVYKWSGEEKFLRPAIKVARYSAAKQHKNGSWEYGELPTQQWIDNFHTGYNLCALRTINECVETSEFEYHIRRGFEFYRTHFFTEDGAPKYFHDRTYPIDVHSVAQSIITLLASKDLDENNVSFARAIFSWAMTNMWDERGYFYYRAYPFFTNKISYMRWSQAWMLLALSTLQEEYDLSDTGANKNQALIP